MEMEVVTTAAIVVAQKLRSMQHLNRMRMEAESELLELMSNLDELYLLRTYELHPKVEQYTEEYLPRYSEKFFFRAYRMKRCTFAKLLTVLCSKGNFEPQNLHGRKAITAERRLLLTLRYLATKKTLFEIAEMFNVAESTACSIVETTMAFLEELQPYVLKWPSEEDAHLISAEFEQRCGFPGVIGAIDGSHIEVKVSNKDRADYTNRKYRQSVILLAVCTHSKLFTYVYAGFPGRAHDSRVLQNSAFWNKVEVQGEDLFYGNFFLIGDSAFPLKNWLITPFRRYNGQPEDERKFNRYLSSGRVSIENSFGWLKGRWRRLKYIDVNSLEKISEIIYACCTLHNFCLIEDDLLPENFAVMEEQVLAPDYELIGPAPEDAAVLKRVGLKQIVQQLQ